MIGVISKPEEAETTKEFFELFKVPWEFYRHERKYDVILSTRDLPENENLNATLVLLYSSENTRFDRNNNISVNPATKKKILLKYDVLEVPIYGNLAILEAERDAVIALRGVSGLDSRLRGNDIKGSRNAGITDDDSRIVSDLVVGLEIQHENSKIIRIGFDLFEEIRILLTKGQPPEFSLIPTLDVHIARLREWILESGIPLVEIPPIPAGYDYACCLTHDIDFEGIRRHKFDRTMLGFLYRATFGSLQGVLTGKLPWKNLGENWKAACLLPAVYAGLAEDIWMPFDQYLNIENGLRSTFFIIPFKNHCGMDDGNAKNTKRSTRYDVCDVKEKIQDLLTHGCEVGVHGIDAWHDTEKGRQEYERIHDATGATEIGIRMHWLYFNDQTPQILEDLGFSYDSTVGYNDAVGYRGGTTQAYRPIGLKKLFELPLHIQDTALFFPDRMGLTEDDAWVLVRELLDNARQYGGVLTINWHDRSLAPERLWGDFYIKLLEHLKQLNVWIDTASRVVRWFDKRRSASFEEVNVSENHVKLRVMCKDDDDVPALMARIHAPKNGKKESADPGTWQKTYKDIPFTNILNVEIPL